MKGKFRNDNYIQIPGFAICEHKLVGNELLIFGIIHGFSQVEGNYFTGSLSYLQSATNSSRNTVIKSLKNLVEKGLIIREEVPVNSVMFVRYKFSSAETALVDKSLNLGSAETDKGSAETAPNNTNNNTNTKLVLSETKVSDENPLLIDLVISEDTPRDIKITKAFFDLIKQNQINNGVTTFTSFNKTKLKSWLIHIERLLNIDKIAIEDLQNIYVWLSRSNIKNSDFWKKNILSTQKLREKFPQLQSAMQEDVRQAIQQAEKEKDKRTTSRLGL